MSTAGKAPTIEQPGFSLTRDFELLDRYQGFSSEVLRLALLGSTGLGLLFTAVTGKDSTLSALKPLLGQGLTNCALSLALVLFGIAAASALTHRYRSSDSMACHIRLPRLRAAKKSDRPPPMPHVLLLIGSLTILFVSGCAWRVGHSEHYIGPVLFRYVGSPGEETHVMQVRHLGFFGEAGTQWGLSIGFMERITAAPRICDTGELCMPVETSRWSKPLSLLPSPVAKRWNLSLLYLRGEGVLRPLFVRRVIYGAAVLLGDEVNAMSIGVVSRTRLKMLQDVLAVLQFDSSHPLETQFVVWRNKPGKDLPVYDILKEEQSWENATAMW